VIAFANITNYGITANRFDLTSPAAIAIKLPMLRALIE
jgi:hypothetical protein